MAAKKKAVKKKAVTKKNVTVRAKSAAKAVKKKASAVKNKVAAKKKSAGTVKPVAGKKTPAKKKAVAKRKTSVQKKASAKKAVPVKKAPPKKKAAKKSTAKKSAAVKKSPGVNKAVRKASPKSVHGKSSKKVVKNVPVKKPVNRKTSDKDASAPKTKRRKTILSAKELRDFKDRLLELRERIMGEINFLSGGNLKDVQRDVPDSGDEGNENFDREFALNLLSSEQDILYEIDEALRRIENKTYGICEMTGDPIEMERLKVLPHARLSVEAQSEIERGRVRYKPFGGSFRAPVSSFVSDE